MYWLVWMHNWGCETSSLLQVSVASVPGFRAMNTFTDGSLQA